MAKLYDYSITVALVFKNDNLLIPAKAVVAIVIEKDLAVLLGKLRFFALFIVLDAQNIIKGIVANVCAALACGSVNIKVKPAAVFHNNIGK